MSLVSPEEIAFGSVDDDLATSIARSVGWRGDNMVSEQEPVRLPQFGPRKIHSTPEIIPDPLLEDVAGGVVIHDLRQWTISFAGVTYTWDHDNTWTAADRSKYVSPKISYIRGMRAHVIIVDESPGAPTPKKPQWDRPFYENRPTERQTVGRPRRRR